METTGSTNGPIGVLYEDKPEIISLLSGFGCNTYGTKKGNVNKQMKYKTYKSIIVGYADNHMIDTYSC